MKLNCFCFVIVTVFVQNVLSIPQISKRDLELAATCDPNVCKPPNCRCASTTLDDKIPVPQIPQVKLKLFQCKSSCSDTIIFPLSL